MHQAPSFLNLENDERVLIIGRRHWSTTVPTLILAGILIVTPFFFLFTLLHQGTLGTVIFAVLLAVGLLFALKAILRWQMDILLVTNKRLIDVDQRGLWARTIVEAAHNHINDVQCEQSGPLDALCNTSTIRIRRHEAPDIVGLRIVRAERLARILAEQREANFHQDKPKSLREELLRRLKVLPDERLVDLKDLMDEVEM